MPAAPVTRRVGRLLLALLAAAVCVVAVAACGGSGGSGSSHHKSHKSSHASAFLAFSQCMRSHGVSNFPDPSGGGGIHLPSGINPFSPSFEAAQAKCSKLMPGGGPGAHPASEQQKQQLLAEAECMRAHGVTGFPDPTTKPPTTQQGYSIIEGLGSNLFLLVPSTINPNSPVFKHASDACHFR
jgi:hypothetical protein